MSAGHVRHLCSSASSVDDSSIAFGGNGLSTGPRRFVARLTPAPPPLFLAPFAASGETMSLAVVFPGQGSQAVGMGRELAQAFPAARLLFEEIDEALRQNLARLMWDG